MAQLERMIADARALVEAYRRRGLPIDAAAARIRLKALLDARQAVAGPRP